MAQNWTLGGYVSEIDDTHGYFGELAPLRLRLAMLLSGQRTCLPEKLAYLELGFGQGHSLNIHAVTNPGTF